MKTPQEFRAAEIPSRFPSGGGRAGDEGDESLGASAEATVASEEALARLALELAAFDLIYQRALHVLKRLPVVVQCDFLQDPRFRITMENFVPGQGWTLWMPSPGPIGAGSRCVVLRPRLATSSEAFAHYVIAHEFAHAHLWNGAWGEITDVEEAADALAASWGFVRPAQWR